MKNMEHEFLHLAALCRKQILQLSIKPAYQARFSIKPTIKKALQPCDFPVRGVVIS